MREAAPVTLPKETPIGPDDTLFGLYQGTPLTERRWDHANTLPDRIVIYQDTLERDFGWDPDLLRAQVERTLRHELAHHLGWHERGVSELGL
jgi:predicted Zn-dependent protease with MMP-like domain